MYLPQIAQALYWLSRADLTPPSWMLFALAGAHLIAAARIGDKTERTTRPYLVAFLQIEAFRLCLSFRPDLRAIVPSVAIMTLYLTGRTLAVIEASGVSRKMAVAGVSLVAVASGVLVRGSGLTGDYARFLWQSWYMLALAFAAVVVAICRRDIYRVSLAAWLGIWAIGGSYVKGGLLCTLWPYTPWRWSFLLLMTYTSLIATTAWIAASAPQWRRYAARVISITAYQRRTAVMRRAA